LIYGHCFKHGQKFSSQAAPEVLAELRQIAETQGLTRTLTGTLSQREA
jgi:hypothetical protein